MRHGRQHGRVSRRLVKRMTVAVLLAVWICIVLCVVQIVQTLRLRAQLRDQREQISHTYNMVQLFHSEEMEEQGSLEPAGSDAPADAVAALGTAALPALPPEAPALSYAEQWGLEQVDKPLERTPRQVLSRLAQLGETDGRIAAIRQNSDAYPEQLLEALANNPEMADFVEHYPQAAHVAAGGLTEREKEEAYPLFLQWDPRWGYASYGDDSCIAVSGCGPTCLSMALYYLTGDETLTPDVIGDYSMENGYYMSGTGTLWALFEDVAPLYGVRVRQPDKSEWEMKAALDQGAVLVCSMAPGDFTAGGHFIVIYGYDRDGFWVNDPNCVARSRRSWAYEELSGQMKHLWIFEG